MPSTFVMFFSFFSWEWVMQLDGHMWDTNAPVDTTFADHVGAAAASGILIAQASLFVAGLVSAALGVGDDWRIFGLDAAVFYCALPLVMWVVVTGIMFSILEREPSARRRAVSPQLPRR